MTITTLLFASYSDALGADAVRLELEPGATISDAVEVLRARPGGSSIPARPLVAVNLLYAEHTRVLEDGDELALIPPVAGG